MNVINETVYEDGQWVALVKVKGTMASVHYVEGRVKVFPVLGKYQRAPRWLCGYVEKWGKERIATFSAEWHAAHRQTFGLS